MKPGLVGKGLLVGGLLGGVLFAGTSFFRPAVEDRTTVAVVQGPFEQWSLFRGTLSARYQEAVSSPLEGAVTLIFLAEEGSLVQPGDLIARFDDAKKKETKIQLQAVADQAEAEYNALLLAEIPLERAQLQQEVEAAERDKHDAETWLADTRELAGEDLASPGEVARAEARLNRAEAAWRRLQQKHTLTQQHIHPARLLQFKSRRDAARQALEAADLEVQQTRVFAASTGRLIYQPLHLNGTFRTVRPGDTVYRNQPFALIADLKDPLVSVDVPENELMLLPPDAPVSVTPIALPDLHLPGRIERLGSTARSLPGRPSWQRFFNVSAVVSDAPDHLRPGMSVQLRVRSHFQEAVLQVPRAAVIRTAEGHFCDVKRGNEVVRTQVQLGPGNATMVSVLQGLNTTEQVVLP